MHPKTASELLRIRGRLSIDLIDLDKCAGSEPDAASSNRVYDVKNAIEKTIDLINGTPGVEVEEYRQQQAHRQEVLERRAQGR